MTKHQYILQSNSPEATIELGRRIATQFRPNDVIALFGDLATGKTTFVKGVCEYYHADQPATSPTFTLINEYNGDIPIFHFDCYRIKHPDEIIMLGFEEYLEKDGIVLIEWPENIVRHIPGDSIELHMDYVNDHTRSIKIQSARPLEL
ncbi:MAG: tRNA (adenosine(37)-N6)-threonylcarbamoyltransferase complex ATPase subunit type 1 TsaE [Candidatus Marinimicrobia bacterium]|nr:tRNA (adenosine(37)-N6)-threonylcarbamoyltransferase complex ATPase subunit type 1 TsaE [Candidatus Neomarinimicrobiota bacterium]